MPSTGRKSCLNLTADAQRLFQTQFLALKHSHHSQQSQQTQQSTIPLNSCLENVVKWANQPGRSGRKEARQKRTLRILTSIWRCPIFLISQQLAFFKIQT